LGLGNLVCCLFKRESNMNHAKRRHVAALHKGIF
jgi:hypothetical protein